LVTVTAPSAGSSGLPKLAERAVVADIIAPAAAVARILRLDSIAFAPAENAFANHSLRTKIEIDFATGVLPFASWNDGGSNGLASG
jgi:hypothetical protein